MPYLEIFNEDAKKIEEIKDFAAIKQALNSINLDLELWDTKGVGNTASQEEILELYKTEVERIKTKHNFKGVDVVNMNPSIPVEKVKDLREKFLAEHIHSDDEVRFFIEGQGVFVVHQENKVYSILCTKGDFIAVPAGTKHWFEMTEQPDFKCIRFFGEDTGWIAQNTGDEISKKFDFNYLWNSKV